MAGLLDVRELQGRTERLVAAHLPDRLSDCGCSKQTLRLCSDCGRVTCRCQRIGLDLSREGRCPCEEYPAMRGYSRAEFERDRMGETGDRLAEQPMAERPWRFRERWPYGFYFYEATGELYDSFSAYTDGEGNYYDGWRRLVRVRREDLP